ncbi:GFA family protein [Jannaschia sp. KMU-145]|uniref:GFA family protein n=1 Tax=Jannaschia halovivens TaxID=3388667 RepID=UPI00396B11EC
MTTLFQRDRLTGGCLCGAVRFAIPAPRAFDVCHCSDCRRWHGGPAIGIDLTVVETLSGDEVVRWYDGGQGAERGFCGTCGSSLFYRRTGNDGRRSIYHGALDAPPTSIPLGHQHFLDRKPETYAIVRG